jgi:tetraacyldisaccharide 4'-kinase
MLRYLRLILFPFSFVYGLIVVIRNKCYDWDIFKSVQFDLPVIGVGNLAVGGSGKTPVTEYLVNLLGDYKIAILSRGYGRKTQGFILADEQATATTIGDEPMQYYRKFPNVTVAVCEDRVKGIQLLEQDHDLIILDDAFQHRHVKAGYNILLFEYSSMFGLSWLLPTGNMREPFSGYKRAQAILITKSPLQLPEGIRLKIENKFAAPQKQALYFAVIRYDLLKPVYAGSLASTSSIGKKTMVFLLTGIAQVEPLLQHLHTQFEELELHRYPDHHPFSAVEIGKLVHAYGQHAAADKCILTTEKDAQRLLDAGIKELLVDLPVFYLPIAVELQAADKLKFNNHIIDYVSDRTRNRTIYQPKDQ